MQAYVDLLKERFKDKSSFCNQSCLYYPNNNKANVVPSPKIIVELDKLGYNFTQKDFDDFIICAVYKKSGSFIVTVVSDYYDKEKDCENCIKIMFTKFSPSPKQFNLLLSCNKYNRSIKYWVDVLIAKNYPFTAEQKKQLVDAGYDVTKFYAAAAVMSIDDIKSTIKSILLSATSINVLTDKILKMDVQYPDDFIESILIIFKVYSTTGYHHTHPSTILEQILNIYIDSKIVKLHDNINDVLVDNKFSWRLFHYFINKGLNVSNKLIDFCASNIDYKILILIIHKQNNIELTAEIMNKMISGTRYMNRYKECYYDDTYNKLVQLGYNNHINREQLDFIDFMISYGIVPDDTTFKFACTHNIVKLFDYCTTVHKMKPSEEIFKYACTNNYKEIFDYCINVCSMVPTEETFKLACEKNYENIFDYCTTKCKMLPISKHLTVALTASYVNLSLINKILCYRVIPEKKHFKLALQENKECMELLIKFGYVMDKDDLRLSIESNHCVDNLERFNILCDEEVYYWSHINNNWYYKDKIKLQDEKLLSLRMLCMATKTTVDELNKYMTENTIEPDGYCLEHACHNNRPIAKYLLDKLYYNPTITTIYWLSRSHIADFSTVYFDMIDIHKIDDAYLSTKLTKKLTK